MNKNAKTSLSSDKENKNNLSERVGSFGGLGTLIPLVLGYITVGKIDPLGIRFMFLPCILILKRKGGRS